MQPGPSRQRDDGEKEKEDDERRQSPHAAPLAESKKRRLVAYFQQAGIQGYVTTHNALVELRERAGRDESEEPEEPGGREVAGNAASTRQWEAATSSASIEDCWKLVTRRAELLNVDSLRFCDGGLRTGSWDRASVALVGQRLVNLIEDRVLRVALAGGHGSSKTAARLDVQLRHFFGGDIVVGTGQLPQLLAQAMREVAAEVAAPPAPPVPGAVPPRARGPVIGGSRTNQ
ncbi:hypothetical protein [Amycolatopsis sp. H20-H5]|uniref:hypothetical protein n=1 Tax=Amycolatopsis sp. H20-H5 TaxID=3046309 RepID=UPI002DC0648F|nr:hypothetical protein [Amycolatopsis sp. H20-H5]MEC3981871.1 hypothetical protein [Amycolatopsis sp. H20-H5]